MNLSFPLVALPYEMLTEFGPAVSQWPPRMALCSPAKRGPVLIFEERWAPPGSFVETIL